MKTYEEMIQYVVDNHMQLRYVYWAVSFVLAPAYGVDRETVHVDIQNEIAVREEKINQARKAAYRAENEARRLANIARRATE